MGSNLELVALAWWLWRIEVAGRRHLDGKLCGEGVKAVMVISSFSFLDERDGFDSIEMVEQCSGA